MNYESLHYGDINLIPTHIPHDVIKHSCSEDRYDCFDYALDTDGLGDSALFLISFQDQSLGFVSLYRIDWIDMTCQFYGRIFEPSNYSEYIKSILAIFQYAFEKLNMRKVSLEYRSDNYFFEDVCKHLRLIYEGKLREKLNCQKYLKDVNIFSLLRTEYIANKPYYGKMFAWNSDFDVLDTQNIDISSFYNRKLFSNSIINPRGAYINDWLKEFVLNNEIRDNKELSYKHIKFSVSIFDDDAIYDCVSCEQQGIVVTPGRYTDLLVVATAQFGHKNTFVQMKYADGSCSESRFSISDWCEKIPNDEYIIYKALACRQFTREYSLIKCSAQVYLQRIRIDSRRVLNEIVLPNDHDIFVFAMGLCSVKTY